MDEGGWLEKHFNLRKIGELFDCFTFIFHSPPGQLPNIDHRIDSSKSGINIFMPFLYLQSPSHKGIFGIFFDLQYRGVFG